MLSVHEVVCVYSGENTGLSLHLQELLVLVPVTKKIKYVDCFIEMKKNRGTNHYYLKRLLYQL